MLGINASISVMKNHPLDVRKKFNAPAERLIASTIRDVGKYAALFRAADRPVLPQRHRIRCFTTRTALRSGCG
jgi:hypothetical protein